LTIIESEGSQSTKLYSTLLKVAAMLPVSQLSRALDEKVAVWTSKNYERILYRLQLIRGNSWLQDVHQLQLLSDKNVTRFDYGDVHKLARRIVSMWEIHPEDSLESKENDSLDQLEALTLSREEFIMFWGGIQPVFEEEPNSQREKGNNSPRAKSSGGNLEEVNDNDFLDAIDFVDFGDTAPEHLFCFDWSPHVVKSEILQRLFDLVDLDGNGRIDFMELCSFLNVLLRGTPVERAMMCCRLHDAQDEGVLRQEPIQVVKPGFKVTSTLSSFYLVLGMEWVGRVARFHDNYFEKCNKSQRGR